ncbi:MAG: sodium:proton antiporter [Planctomycetota bacterium]|jgi:Na+/H+ antiporter NhaD/arsenite permease-like protein|nr:MAG: sodium:proton antiporter [Planctomycetota bacterium]
MHDAAPAGAGRLPLWGIAIALAAYLVAAALGLPQHGRDLLVHSQAAHADDHDAAPHGDAAVPESHAVAAPPVATVLPFALLLAAIAILPLTPGLSHWWEHNSSKLVVAGLLAAITLGYYLLGHRHPIDLHFPAHAVVQPAAAGLSWSTVGTVLINAILAEYIPFITLLFALYVITGGVRIEGDLEATPTTNAAFLAVGAVLASFIGTTGAAMLLVRPLLETNRERRHVAHTLVFFIFIVCNCGGLLLPIGDPPLFLGYLQGVDFLWTMSLWNEWLFTNGSLLVIYWLWDTLIAHPRETRADVVRDRLLTRSLRFSGLWPNLPLMAGVIAAVAFLDPSKPFPGTSWHPWIYLRETVLLGLVGLSLLLGSGEVRRKNAFTYGAILEVAALFIGIFICMQPALALLHVHGASLGLSSPQSYFWATGSLSAVLDNAPTYLVFFEAAGIDPTDGLTGEEARLLAAISLGAVFLGAMTYIGNGPNFMVKAIAEQAGVKMPSFFGYVMYSMGVLLPVFAVMAWLFV